MSLININFFSEVLGRNTNINVIIPQKQAGGKSDLQENTNKEKYKTLLLLHGLGDDNTIWIRNTSIESYAGSRGIAVILPGADKSFYTDMKHGDRYYTYISNEVLKIAREYLPLSEKREDNFIAGLSMGGYGAIKTALKNPDKFACAAGLSTVADIELFMTKHTPYLRECVFGADGKVPESEDLFYLAQKCEKCEPKPRIYMGIGLQDFMYEENTRLRDVFMKLDYDFTYRESEGTHSWTFWDEYIQYVLKWMFD